MPETLDSVGVKPDFDVPIGTFRDLFVFLSGFVSGLVVLGVVVLLGATFYTFHPVPFSVFQNFAP